MAGHPVTTIATVKTVNALYKAQKLLRMNGAPIPHVWKSGKVFKIGYTSSNTEGIRKGIAALSGSTGVQLVQNPTVSLPRNKWVNAMVRVTSDGKIQAKVSSPALSRVLGRKMNPSSKKPSKYPKCSLCGKAIRDSTYTQGPDGPEHNVCPPTRGSGLYYMSRNPRKRSNPGRYDVDYWSGGSWVPTASLSTLAKAKKRAKEESIERTPRGDLAGGQKGRVRYQGRVVAVYSKGKLV